MSSPEPQQRIIYVPNGHSYTVHKSLSDSEKALVSKKIDQLTATVKKGEKLEKELAKHSGINTSKEAIRYNEVLLEIIDNNEESSKIIAELDGALNEALHNCFRLGLSDIQWISRDERIAIFKELCK